MLFSIQRPILFITGLLILACTVGSGVAQYYNPYYRNPYYPQGYGGNVLSGRADVINAQGNLYIQSEQARLAREQAEQAKIDTKRKAFDEKMYEKAMTPTYTQEKKKVKASQVQRVMADPGYGEITAGQTLNILLPFLDQLLVQGIQGPPVPLDPDMLKQINVAAGNTESHAGLLKDGGKLTWPVALRGPSQQKIDALLPKAVDQARTNKLEPSVYFQIKKEMAKLPDLVIQKMKAEELDGATYLESKRFIASLETSVGVLQKPDAAKYLTGAYSAKGRDVPELVYNMSRNGLSFAPCTPGTEAAYVGLHRSMVTFANGAESSPGFRVQGGGPIANDATFQKDHGPK
jgi:hypothetical protein